MTSVVIPHSLRVGEIVTLVLGFGLSTLAVAARVYTKFHIMRDKKLEDYLSVLGWLSAVEATIYCPIIVIVKLAILMQYITIFAPQRRHIFYYAVHIVAWINIVYYFISTFFYIFECTPREKLWNPTMPGHCIGSHQLGVASGTLNVVSDFLILTLPLPIIWRLQMSTRKKVGVIAIFALGGLACIASVFRLVYSIQLLSVPSGTLAYLINIDITGVWSFAEIAIGIIVGCLPILPRFFRYFFSDGKTSSSTSSTIRNDRLSWRRLFRKSTSQGSNSSKTGGSSQKLPGSRSTTYTAQNLSGPAFIGGPSYWAKKELPRLPSSTSSGDFATLIMASFEGDRDQINRKPSDLESGPRDTAIMRTVHIENDIAPV